MNLKRSATLGAACGAVVVWIAGASNSGTRGPIAIPARRPAPVEKQGQALAAEIARLHERLRPTATPLQNRDLFRFGGRSASAPRTIVAAPTAPARDVAAAPVIAAPTLKLIGLAEDAGADGPVRTAIISSPGDLFLVKEGDAVAGHYRVTRISSEVVELTDDADGTILRLALK